MTLPTIGPDDVRVFAPDMPRATEGNCQDANDWLAYLLEVRQVNLDSFNERQQRDFTRAACAYALHVAAGETAAGTRASAGSGGVAKNITLGPLKIEKTAVSSETVASGLVTNSDRWLKEAYRYLRRAGLSLPVIVAGASR